MTLTALPFLFLLIGVATALVAATMLLWNRWASWWVPPMRLLCLLCVMAAGAVLAADVVNRSYGFYSSLDDLLGRVPANAGANTAPVPDLRVPANERGRVVQVRLGGARAGITRDAQVYLPAAYFRPSQARRRFPVVELFHGYPGNPGNWIRQMHLAQVLDAEIASRHLPAVIAVVPTDDDPGRDSECVNAVRGQQDETYLAVDVPADIRHDFRALDTPAAGPRSATRPAGSARSTSPCTIRSGTRRRHRAPGTTAPSSTARPATCTSATRRRGAGTRHSGWSPTGVPACPSTWSPAAATTRRCGPCRSCGSRPKGGCPSSPWPCRAAATTSRLVRGQPGRLRMARGAPARAAGVASARRSRAPPGMRKGDRLVKQQQRQRGDPGGDAQDEEALDEAHPGVRGGERQLGQ